MRSNFKLLSGLFIYVSRTLHRKLFDSSRQGDRPDNPRAATPDRLNNFHHRLIKHAIIKAAQPDTNSLIDFHAQLLTCRPEDQDITKLEFP